MSQFPYQSQQPAWVSASSASAEVRVREFMRGVYAWMFGGLALTSAAAMWMLFSPAMQKLVFGNPIVFYGLIIAEFVLVMWVQVRITRLSASTAASMFLIYSLLNGLTLSSIFMVYATGAIANAFITAALMFAGMAVFGYVTKRDLTSMGGFLIMGAWGLFIGYLVNMFLKSSMMDFMLSAIGVLLFMGLTAYYNQRLKQFALAEQHRENLSILGALWLYISFINLFLSLLRLFGGSRR
jgi:FtsH-binding integral membrane protein